MIKKVFWTVIFTVYTGLVFYGSIYPVQQGPPLIAIPGADKLIHAGEFTLFTLIGYVTFSYYTEGEKRSKSLLAFSIFYGGLTELVQMFFPYRTASVLDLLANLFGILVGLVIIQVMKRLTTGERTVS